MNSKSTIIYSQNLDFSSKMDGNFSNTVIYLIFITVISYAVQKTASLNACFMNKCAHLYYQSL